MFETLETLTDVKTTFASWRAQHSDLPVVLYALSFLKFVFSKEGRVEGIESFQFLRRRGSQLARRRALFIAAEAIGHLPGPQKGIESQTIIEDLGVVIKEGNSLHKVRALRAMRFIASEECIPFLERALEDGSPWVQATALHTLFRLNLRHRKPRRVFQAFLLSTFRRGLTPKSLFSWSDYSRNFYLNKGLFGGLVKESGGIPLAGMSLVLWFITIFFKTAIPLVVIALMFVVTAPVLLYAIVDMPFWIQRAFTESVLPSKRHFFLALLDYSFIVMFVLIAPPLGLLNIFLVFMIWGMLHLLSSFANSSSSRLGDELRALNRFLLGGVTAYFAARLGKSYVTFLAITVFAVAQLIWALPGIVKVVSAERVKLKKWGISVLTFIRELAAIIEASLLYLLRRVAFQVRLAPRSAYVALSLLVLLLVAILIAPKLGFELQDLPLLPTRLQFDNLLGILKPYFHLVLGVTLLLFYSFLFSLVVHLLWDELQFIEQIRFQTLASRPSHFNSMGEFVTYVIRVVKNAASPIGIRVRAVVALGQVPLANPGNINQLLDLAEDEDLPPKVRDAIFQIVDAAEKRLQRGQNSTLSVDMEVVNKQIEPLWSPGSLLRTNIRYALLALLLLSVASAGLVWLTQDLEVTGKVALVELFLGAVFLLYYIVTLGEKSIYRKSLLIMALGLVSVSLTHPFQSMLVTSDWVDILPHLGIEFIDAKTLSALLVPTMLFVVGAQVGHTIYLLDADIPVNSTPIDSDNPRRGASIKSGILYAVGQRLLRLQFQSNISIRVLLLGMLVAAFQSEPLQELINLRGERMPAFVSDRSSPYVRLENLPMDGRVVRIALVSAPDPDITPLIDETFPRTVYSREGKLVFPQIDEIYYYDRVCYGEVWISMEAGQLQAWNTLPSGCLEVPALAGETATFNLSVCGFHQPVRLLALVYNSTRSVEVKKKADPANAISEVLSASPAKPRVLAHTLSPFVRPVWSAPWQE